MEPLLNLRVGKRRKRKGREIDSVAEKDMFACLFSTSELVTKDRNVDLPNFCF